MGSDDVDEAFNALNQRFASELASDADSRLTDSLNALRALADDELEEAPEVDLAASPILDVRESPDHGEVDPDDELGRVVAALKLGAARSGGVDRDETDDSGAGWVIDAAESDADFGSGDGQLADNDYADPSDDETDIEVDELDIEAEAEADEPDIELEADIEADEPDIELEAQADEPDIELEADEPDIEAEADEPDIEAEADEPDIEAEEPEIEEQAIEAETESLDLEAEAEQAAALDAAAEDESGHPAEVAAAINAAFDRIQTEADRPLPPPEPASDELVVAEAKPHIFSSLIEDEAEQEAQPTETDSDDPTELPPFLKDWTRTPDDPGTSTKPAAQTEPERSTPLIDEPLAASAADTGEALDNLAALDDDSFDDEVPAFVNTGETRAVLQSELEVDGVAGNGTEAFDATRDGADQNQAATAAHGATMPPELESEALPIIPLGAARLHPMNAAPLDTAETRPFPQVSGAPQRSEPVAVGAAPPSTSPRPAAPWIPRLAAVAGIALLIVGSAVLWISLLGSPGSSDSNDSETTASGAIATALPTTEVAQDTQEPPSGVERGTVTVSDDRLDVEITRCDANGMRGEISTSGEDWVTTRIQARFVSESGTVLTTSNPVEELVPTTIRVPFRFDYEPSLAPAGFENDIPWCEVTVEALPSS